MTANNKLLGFRKSALLEIIIFFIIMVLLDIFAFSGNRFFDVSPHPYWIIVLLMAIQYGTAEAVLASIIASFALLAGSMPDQTIYQDKYDYILFVAKHPLMWFTASVILGELRQRHIRERDRLKDELEAANQREENISEAYKRLKDLKETMELRIAGQFRSSIDAYKAAKAIEKLHPTDVLQGIDELVRAVINPQKFSVYVMTAKGLECTITAGWNDTEQYTRVYDANSPIYNEIVGKQHTISVVNSEHERILAEQGVLAGPLINRETGEITGMLKIEKLGFLDLNLGSIETFTAICEWIGMAMTNARNHQVIKSDSVVNPDHQLMTYNYFKRHSDYIATLAKRVGFDVSMVIIKLSNPSLLSEETRKQVAIILSDAVNKTLRKVDLAFDYRTNGEEYAIVLPSTNIDGANIVVNKIMQIIQTSIRRSLKNIDFTCTVHPLHIVQQNNKG